MSETILLRILKETEIFHGLNDDHFKLISKCGKIATFNSQNTIIKEGQANTNLYIILSGQLEVALPEETASPDIDRFERVKINTLKKGNCIGEYSAIDRKPASASVIAIEPSVLFRISRDHFQKIVSSSDYVAKTIYYNLLHILIERLRSDLNEKGVLEVDLLTELKLLCQAD